MAQHSHVAEQDNLLPDTVEQVSVFINCYVVLFFDKRQEANFVSFQRSCADLNV